MERDRLLSLVVRTSLIVLFLWMVRSLMVPVALGVLLALLLTPVKHRLTPRLGKAGKFTPVVLTAASLILVVIPFVFIAIKVVQSISDYLSRDWGATFARIQNTLREGVDIGGKRVHLGGEQLQSVVQDVAQRAATFAAGFVGGLTTTIPAFLVGLFLFAVALYYGLQDGTKLGRWLFRLSPFQPQQTRELFSSVRETVNGALLGLIATALVQGGLTLLALYIFGVPNAFLLGVLATILAFTPIIGTVPVTVGAAAYLFMMGKTGGGIGMLVAALIIGVSDNVVRPWVQSSSTSMHPFIALLGIFGGIELFGAAGVFLGPIVAAMAIWTIETYAKLHSQGNHDAASQQTSTLVVVNAGAVPQADEAAPEKPEKPREKRELDGPAPPPPPSKPLTTAR